MIFNYEKDDYKNGLLAVWDNMNAKQQALLINLYNAPSHTATSEQISLPAGYQDHRGFNLFCKNIGPRFMEAIGKSLPQRTEGREPGYWRIWASMDEKNNAGSWLLVMRPGLAAAIKELRLMESDHTENMPVFSPIHCQEMLADFECDARKTPDSRRKGKFRSGWLDAAVRGKQRTEQTLRELTWTNLGYRLGKKHGPLLEPEINAFYDAFAQQYMASRGASDTDTNAPEIMPGELPPTRSYREGTVRQILVNAYERSREAREECIAKYGAQCVVCGFDFGAAYGSVAKGFIHVHHLRQVSDVGEAYQVNPVTDLRPVCPNCHAVIHKTDPPMSIDAVRALLEQNRRT